MLKVPLNQTQIDAACRLHVRLRQWQSSDAALTRLRHDLPGFDPDACLLKCIAINALYSTQVLAIGRMAEHVAAVMSDHCIGLTGPELVLKIAALPPRKNERQRYFTSFSAKFCHFFVDEQSYPIYDDAAREVLKLHLGKSLAIDKARPYLAFCKNIARVRDEAHLNGSGRNLDRYLWIAGMYKKWLAIREKPKRAMNVELRELFESPGIDAARDLEELLPHSLKLLPPAIANL